MDSKFTEEDVFVQDATTDEIASGCMLGLTLLGSLFIVVSGWGISSTQDPSALQAATLGVTPFLVLLTVWAVRTADRRKDGYRFSLESFSRVVDGITAWKRPWDEARFRLERHTSLLTFVRPVTLGIYDTTGKRLGVVALKPSHETKVGRSHRLLLAQIVKSAKEFEVPRLPLHERRKGYLWKSAALILGGSAATAACIFGMVKVLDMTANGHWNRPLALVSLLGMFPSFGAAILGVIELTHFWRDRDQPDETASLLAEFVERPVLNRVDMTQGVWYHYRNADKIEKDWTFGAKVMSWIIGGVGIASIGGCLVKQSFGFDNYRGDTLLTMLLFCTFGIGVFWWMAIYLGKVARHRFLIEGDLLTVETKSGLRTFPAPARKKWRGPNRKGSWLSVTDSYGKWPKRYCLDPCWIEPDTDEV